MARPRKLQMENTQQIDEQEMIIMDTGVKQVQRVISKKNVTDLEMGYFAVGDVDAYLSTYLADGWKLMNTHYLGENPEGYLIWYVLVKQ
jgi:hypothetical protein